MASPVGHTLSGLSLYLLIRGRTGTRLTLLEGVTVVLVSNLPDLDLIPGMLAGDSSLWHHRFTHSFFFAFTLSICIILALVLLKGAGEIDGRMVVAVGALICLHIGLDFFTEDPHPPHGSQVFWPFSREYFLSPWTFLDRVRREPPNLMMIREWVLIALKEILIFGPPLLGILWWRSRGENREG
jgi:membrane-bound metal-dependent hydrolase YbcI (DUF457 family)